jgi:hypothetical protein
VDWTRWSESLATAVTRHIAIDFSFWGYVKDSVHATGVPDMDTLRRIIEAVAAVTTEMLQNKGRKIEYRLDILQAANGVHVEEC